MCQAQKELCFCYGQVSSESSLLCILSSGVWQAQWFFLFWSFFLWFLWKNQTNTGFISQVKYGNQPQHVCSLNTAGWFSTSVVAEHRTAKQPLCPAAVTDSWAPPWQQPAVKRKKTKGTKKSCYLCCEVNSNIYTCLVKQWLSQLLDSW